ncbi:MAG TPA: ferritin-like domain-containing protein [Acidimicrobiales bacterium]
MASSSAGFHESADVLQAGTMDRHRAIVSLMEELEAVDWYDQRIDAAGDEDLKEILRHNRDEEKEHAAMLLEWLRRRDGAWDQFLRQYLFTESPITEIEEAEEGGGAAPAESSGSLGLGALADKEML